MTTKTNNIMEDKVIVIDDAFAFNEKHNKRRYNHISKEWFDCDNQWTFDELETIFNIKNICKIINERDWMKLYYKDDIEDSK